MIEPIEKWAPGWIEKNGNLLVLADLFTEDRWRDMLGEVRQKETAEDLYQWLSLCTMSELLWLYTGACKEIVGGHPVNHGINWISVAALTECALVESLSRG